MQKLIKHFGCTVRNVPEAVLTRENYAIINDKSRKNSFMHDKQYIGLSYIEANEKFIRDIEHDINYKLEKYLDFYHKAISTESNEILNNYISKCKKDLIDKKKKEYGFKNTLSQIQFETLAYGKKLHSKCNDDVKKAWLECQKLLNEIDNYTIDMVLKNVEKPAVLLQWQSINGTSSINVTKEFIRDFIIENYKLPYYSDEWCNKQKSIALENFDLNMLFYKTLDKEKFNNEIDIFLKKNKGFVEVKDLNDYSRVSGIYILVLDEYKQIYIGITEKGIKERIKEHWTRKMPLDRLLFGGIYDSKLSIDSFRQLDTTRIYAYPCKEKGNLLSKEYRLTESQFSQEFLCNRCSGGGKTWAEAVASRKKHNLKE